MSSSYQVNYTGAQVEVAIEKALDLYTNSQIDNFLLQKVDTTDLAAVALSGSYNDLLNKPDIPAAQIQSDWNQSDESALDFIKNKPTIPSGLTVDQIYDPTSTNAQSGVAIAGAGFLTEHQSLAGYVPTARTINGKALSANITLTASDVGALPSNTVIPSKVSDLTNDSGFVTSDTKNTAGTTNKTGTKMFLAAATSQGANPQTFSNSNCYIGTDNCLYSGGVKVLTTHQSLSGYVPTSRTINSKALSANITLTASDVGALPGDTVIPTKVSDLTNDAGYTPNTGTITGIKMNGASKGTSGVVDLGTVLTGHQTVKVNGVTGATTNNFGTCSTAAGTAAKTVTLTAGTFALETGARVLVKFTVTNTAANPTLNVGSTGAKAIQYRGSAITAGYLAANRTYEFVYDGTNYQLVGDINTDTNNVTAQNISTANNTYPILLGNTANATANIGNKATLFGSGIKANPSTSTIVATTFQGNATSATTASKLGTADKGSATQPIYLEDGVPTACTYTLAKSVPSDAKFTDTVYTHPTTSGNKHIPSGGSSGQFLKWSADGTATWAADNDTKNTAGSTDTSSKIFLVGATSQAANLQTYSHDTAFVDANGRVNSAAPASDANDTTVATTKWVKDQSYVTTNTTQTISGTKTFTGTPVFSNDAMGAQLTVNRSNNASGYSVIRYTNNGTVKGYLGVHYEGRPIWGNSSGTYYNLVRNSTLDTAVGSATKGVYISSSGVATAMTYSLNKDVPSNAVFTDTKNTAGSTDSSSKLFLIGATSQAANPQTYSHDTAFVDTNGRVNSAAPASDANDTTVATTKWVKDHSYVTTNTAQTISAVKTFSAEPLINSNIQFGNVSTGSRGIWGKVGDTDYWRVYGGATASNGGYMELATADDGNEPIYIRQYTGQFSTVTRTATLLNASGNTELPGSLSIGNGGATMQYNSTTEAIEFVFA